MWLGSFVGGGSSWFGWGVRPAAVFALSKASSVLVVLGPYRSTPFVPRSEYRRRKRPISLRKEEQKRGGVEKEQNETVRLRFLKLEADCRLPDKPKSRT